MLDMGCGNETRRRTWSTTETRSHKGARRSRLGPYAKEHDSHIMEWEAIVPGGRFLGRAKGDHSAVAMPFYGNPKVKKRALKIIDRNRFPRPALIEAAVRIVAEDLKAR